ncbi:DUF4177 domain-containing protein [Siculibacillus lacustris]|uniref:DUF4177 domain-containing protein n=1 Tax=Siculibacillus lacustris TaxID=1549641 RepID=A0A4Q9VH46_9HYPH|nr:DUF4177 domain-containing protein [Siculibacillus lacustris]TBW34403.1 DUF4177 domain-containing protein [Siculibacillus lacustris]
MEYRIERIELSGAGDRDGYLTTRLNEFGQDGWRVSSIDLTPRSSFAAQSIPVLLERPFVAEVKTRNAA